MALGLEALRLDEDRAAHVVPDVAELLALADLAHGDILAGGPCRRARCPPYHRWGRGRRDPHRRHADPRRPRRDRPRRAARACSGSATRSAATGCEDEAAEKEAWVSEVLREWGSCGRVALVDDAAVGYLIYAPPSYVPGAAGFATAPASPDAVLLTTAYVGRGYDGGGVGRLLVRAMARDLVGARDPGRRGLRDGGTGVREPLPAAGGVPGAGRLQDPPTAPATPRMRMDLRSRRSPGATRSRRRWSGWSASYARRRNRHGAPRRRAPRSRCS